MKTILLLIAILFGALIACTNNQEPEFYIDGKPYRTVETCIEDAYVTERRPFYGYNPALKMTTVLYYRDVQVLKCIEYRIDTIPCR